MTRSATPDRAIRYRPAVASTGGRAADRARARRAGELLRWSLVAIHDDEVARAPTRATPPAAAGIGDLTERAEYHRLTPILHSLAGRLPDLDPSVAAALEASYHFAVRRHLFVLDDLAWVAAVLDDLTPDVLVIKGPILSAVVYDRADLRSYGDLDVVVRADGFARAVELLTDAGATFREPDWNAAVARRLGEVSLALPSGTVLDLHWHLVPIGTMRDRFTIDMGALFESARTVAVDGRPYRTLAPEATVVHLALHAVLCGGDRLGWLEDLHQALRPAAGAAPDHGAVLDVARSWGATGALAVQLDRLDRTVGSGARSATGVGPTSASAGLARVAARAADRLQPPERSTGERTAGVTLAWATAPTVSRSALELGRMGTRWVRRQGEVRPERVRDGTEATPPPTPRQWRDYLATVGTG